MRLVLSLALCLGLAPRAHAQAFFDVPAAYPTIQAAIDAATTAGVVRIAPGTYTGSGNVDLDPRGKAITIRGDSAQTTVIDCQGSAATPHRAFRILAGGTALVIERLRIENGYEAEGGAMEIRNARPSIRECLFRACEAAQLGGAVVLGGVAPARFIDCRFESCRAYAGGALHTRSTAAANLSNCDFLGGSAAWRGGALFLDAVPLVASACTFDSNRAVDLGGAIEAMGGAFLRVQGCNFVANGSDGSGGAIGAESQGTVVDVETSSFAQSFAGPSVTQGPGGPNGGAIDLRDCVSELRDCQLVGNRCRGEGGAIYFAFGNTRMERCRFEQNTAGEYGGAIGMDGDTTLLDCELLDNQALGFQGGAISAQGGRSLTMQGGSIVRNVARGGAGIFFWDASGAITDACFEDNDASSDSGGALFVTGPGASVALTRCGIYRNIAGSAGALVTTGGARVEGSDCAFVSNVAIQGGTGACESSFGSMLRLVRCELRDNQAASWFGAVRVHEGTAELEGCLLVGNAAAGESGAVGVSGSTGSVLLESCTIADNFSNGAALRCEQGTLTLENSIVWSNFRSGLVAQNGGVITSTYSDIQGGFPGLGNRNQNPLFANAAAGDYRLSSISPLRDAGSSALVPATLTVDLDGSPRIVGLAVDIGADEYLAPLPGTLDPLRLVTRVNGAGAELTTKSAPAGSTLELHFEALTTPLQSAVGLVLGNAVPVAAPIFPTPGLPGLQLDLASALFFVGGTAPPPFGVEYLGPNGIARSYRVPPGLGGLRLRLQGVALGPMTQSGFLAFSDAQELIF